MTHVSDLTGFSEILDGRVKTLHPKIYGGLLARRDRQEHMTELKAQGICPIDIVVVNLYPFVQTVNKPNVSQEEALENIRNDRLETQSLLVKLKHCRQNLTK